MFTVQPTAFLWTVLLPLHQMLHWALARNLVMNLLVLLVLLIMKGCDWAEGTRGGGRQGTYPELSLIGKCWLYLKDLTCPLQVAMGNAEHNVLHGACLGLWTSVPWLCCAQGLTGAMC